MRQAHTYALVFDGRQIKPFTAFCLYDDEESLEIGKQPIQVIYTPGHTSGSVCYYFGDFVFTGDTILYQHVGSTDTPGANVDQLISSVSRLVEQLPGETVVFPGHGRTWTIREARVWWQHAVISPPQYKRFGGI
jgi:glyoxylase-like metal-dependent hydrolase (beta-lactamase superfamily II)